MSESNKLPQIRGPADYLVATMVAEFCYHAATTPSRSRVIYRHHHSVVIVGITSA